jgi:hypothetical protein
MALINHLAKGCFVLGLNNEGIQTTMQSNGETAFLSTCIDADLEDESSILSVKDRCFSVQRGYGILFKGQPEYRYKQTMEVAVGKKC